jgi:hypothetical protein
VLELPDDLSVPAELPPVPSVELVEPFPAVLPPVPSVVFDCANATEEVAAINAAAR